MKVLKLTSLPLSILSTALLLLASPARAQVLVQDTDAPSAQERDAKQEDAQRRKAEKKAAAKRRKSERKAAAAKKKARAAADEEEAASKQKAGDKKAAPKKKDTAKQESDRPQGLPQRNDARPIRGDGEYVKLIQQLEQGMAALRAVGAKAELKRIAEIADRLREERAAVKGMLEREQRVARAKQLDLEELETRVKIIGLAARGCGQAGHESAAKRLGQVIRVGKMMLAGAPEERIQKAYEAAPQSEELIDLLKKASHLYAERDQKENAHHCASLAKFYSERYAGSAKRERVAAPPQGRTFDLRELADRVEVLRLARDAQQEAGYEAGVKQMNEMIHVGELQLEGASQEKIVQVLSGELTMEKVIGHLRSSAKHYRAWRRPQRAKACAALAEFYVKREAQRAAER